MDYLILVNGNLRQTCKKYRTAINAVNRIAESRWGRNRYAGISVVWTDKDRNEVSGFEFTHAGKGQEHRSDLVEVSEIRELQPVSALRPFMDKHMQSFTESLSDETRVFIEIRDGRKFTLNLKLKQFRLLWEEYNSQF